MRQAKRNRVVLGELGEWGSGGTPLASRPDYYGGQIPWLIIEDLNDGYVEKAARTISQAGLENSAAKVVPAGTLLIAMYGSIGKLGITRIEAATNQAIAYCKCNPTKVDTRYLFYLFQIERGSFLRAGRGGTQQNISQEFLKSYEVLIPALEEQLRITRILESADRLRRMHRYALDLSEGLLGAVFREMFGDPLRNPRQFKSMKLRDVCSKFSDGPFGSHLKSEHYRSSGIRVIRLQNIGVGRFVDDDRAYISSDHFATISKHRCEPGDVLIGTLGDPNLRACLLPKSVSQAVNKADCIQARPNVELADAQWLCTLLNDPSTLKLIPGLVHGQTRSRVSMGELAELPVPVPPIALQRRFAEQALQHERLLVTTGESLRQSEHLFQTLLHEAFGEG